MSQNLDIVRRSFEAFNRRDWDTLFESWDEAIEVRPDPSWPESAPTVGRDAARALFEQLEDGLNFRFMPEIVRLYESGNRVLAWIRATNEGAATGLPLEFQFGQLHEFRDGKVTVMSFHFDEAEALATVGLQPPQQAE
jgi:ketosteroid isomerase-like protein